MDKANVCQLRVMMLLSAMDAEWRSTEFYSVCVVVSVKWINLAVYRWLIRIDCGLQKLWINAEVNHCRNVWHCAFFSWLFITSGWVVFITLPGLTQIGTDWGRNISMARSGSALFTITWTHLWLSQKASQIPHAGTTHTQIRVYIRSHARGPTTFHYSIKLFNTQFSIGTANK